jgi:antitoxin (DNA-binding transcriptional repressor) of toxin-antitoxin stability system
MAVIRVTDAEAAWDFAGLLAKVRGGEEVHNADREKTIAVVQPLHSITPRKTLSAAIRRAGEQDPADSAVKALGKKLEIRVAVAVIVDGSRTLADEVDGCVFRITQTVQPSAVTSPAAARKTMAICSSSAHCRRWPFPAKNVIIEPKPTRLFHRQMHDF